MEVKHNVEYLICTDGMGNVKVAAQMGQKELAKLLLQEDVTLLNVNKSASSYKPRRAKKK